jgi:periplasmic divalent cation tolerance protein
MADDERFQIVLTTAGSEAQAAEIAQALVERRLAACVNIVRGACSFYRWKGKVVEDGESLLLIKSERHRFDAIRDAIRELHTYELPEVVTVPITGGDPGYLAWLAEQVAPE